MGPARRRVRVLAADRHPLYRDALTRAIRERPELELVGQARDGREALDAIGSEQPDVAVIDRTLAGLSGDQVLNAVGRDSLHTRVVMIAAEPDPELVYAAIANGAAGYLTKDADARELCDAIAAVARGRTVLSPQLQAGIAGEIRLRAVDERPVLSDSELTDLGELRDTVMVRAAAGRRLALLLEEHSVELAGIARRRPSR